VVERLNLFREGDSGVEQSINARSDRNALVTSKFDEFLVVGLGFTYETAGADNDTTVLDNPAVRNYGVHNMHLGLLYQAGLAAVVGVLLILTTALRQLMGLLRRADTELYLTTLALIGSFTAVNVNAMFQPTSFDRFYWMPVALTGCLWSIRRNELRDAAKVRASGADGAPVGGRG
jgi:O-antigen ligase